MRHLTLFALLLSMSGLALTHAVTPPDKLNHQGVLRDAAGEPLDGSVDMVFTFFDTEAGGLSIFIDSHLAANSQAIVVTDGLFSAVLGDGDTQDGAGHGVYSRLSQVFGDFSDVWIEIEINGETLAPRLAVNSAPYAFNADQLGGKSAAEFVDSSTLEQYKMGRLLVGQTTGTTNDTAIEGYATIAGGYFRDSDSTGQAFVGAGDFGIQAHGDYSGGSFNESDTNASALLAYDDYGVYAKGANAGAYFFTPTPGSSTAFLATYSHGISASGNARGGWFADIDDSGLAYLASGNNGVFGWGSESGGYFGDNDDSGRAWVGWGDYGINAAGNFVGGYFADANGTGNVRLGYGDRGVHAWGNNSGGYFNDLDSSSYAYVGYGSYKIWGSGAVSFVQNHPDESDKVVVYHAPESSEVGVYTRGSDRLFDGKSVVALDATFAWVTNPDLGLTAHLTPRGAFCPLYVESVASDEIVVRSDDPACAGAAFDYQVWGLRVGFEGVTAVQPKIEQAYIPSMKMHEEYTAKDPSLAGFTAGSRFEAIEQRVFSRQRVDRSRADELVRRIHEFDPEVDTPAVGHSPDEPSQPIATRVTPESASDELGRVPPPRRQEAVAVSASAPSADSTGPAPSGERPSGPALAARPSPADTGRLPVEGSVEAGDLLVASPEGTLVRSFGESDPAVAGIASEDAVEIDGETLVAVAGSGIVTLKVDADLGAVRPGDLLVSSPTPGHAMRAYAAIPGTVIAKALQPLENGRGTIRVLITPR